MKFNIHNFSKMCLIKSRIFSENPFHKKNSLLILNEKTVFNKSSNRNGCQLSKN